MFGNVYKGYIDEWAKGFNLILLLLKKIQGSPKIFFKGK